MVLVHQLLDLIVQSSYHLCVLVFPLEIVFDNDLSFILLSYTVRAGVIIDLVVCEGQLSILGEILDFRIFNDLLFRLYFDGGGDLDLPSIASNYCSAYFQSKGACECPLRWVASIGPSPG